MVQRRSPPRARGFAVLAREGARWDVAAPAALSETFQTWIRVTQSAAVITERGGDVKHP